MIYQHPLFKGMARPPLIFGVPIIPLFFASAFYVLFVLLTEEFLYLLGLIPLYLILRGISYRDDRVFNNLFLKTQFLIKTIQATHRPPGEKAMDRLFNLLKGKKKFGALSFAPNLSPKQKKNAHFDESGDIDISKHIPYSTHVTPEILITKDDAYLTIWETNGIDFQTAVDGVINRETDQFRQLIRTLAANHSGYYHKTREEIDIVPNLKSSNPFASEVYRRYTQHLSRKQFRRTKNYLTLVWQPYNLLDKGQVRVMANKRGKKEVNRNLETFKEIASVVDAAIRRSNGNFSDSRVLKLKEMMTGSMTSEPINFINFLLTGERREIAVCDAPFYELLGDRRYFFLDDILQVKNYAGSKFYRSIEIKEYPDTTSSGIFDLLMLYPANTITTHTFEIVDRSKAMSSVSKQQKRLRSGEDKAFSQQAELVQLQDDIMSGNVALGQSSTTFFISAENIEEIKKKSNELMTELQRLGIVATFSDTTLPSAFFSQLPGNLAYRPRQSLITSHNFADFADFHGFYSGKAAQNPWGPAVSLFSNAFGEAFYFNFHEETPDDDFGKMSLAHSVVTGASGSGKTFLVSFLLVCLQQFAEKATFPETEANKKATFLYLDKDHGAEACIKALGGKYFKIQNGEPTGFNPFQLENTAGNREFLFNLFKYIATLQEPKFTVNHARELTQAIDSVMDMPCENRVFGVSRLMEFLSYSSQEEAIGLDLSNRLSLWVQGQKYGWVFDNENDEIEFTDQFINYGFDGTEFLDNKEITNTVAYYLLHRFQLLMDGRRLAIFIDEFWKWLRGDIFAEFVFDKLKTLRKLNAFIVAATQSPSDVLRNEIAAAIIEQTENKIFLANKDALESEYVGTKSEGDEINRESSRSFGCTPKEFNIIKSFMPSSHQALVKKGSFSTVINVDLRALGSLARVLSTSKSDSERLEAMGVGTYLPPEQWLIKYIGEQK